MKLEVAARAIVGSKKPQQDAWRVLGARGADTGTGERGSSVLPGGALVILADGIGGYAGGDVASKLACDNFGRTFFATSGDARNRLYQGLAAANQAIAKEKRERPDLSKMGSTLIGAYLDGDRMSFVSVGDSLLMRFRDDELHRVNRDHSYFDFVDRSALGTNDPKLWSAASLDKSRPALTIAVTGGTLEAPDYEHSPQIETRHVQQGDVLIFASDGIETLNYVQIQNFVRALLPKGVGAVADGLIGAVEGIGANRDYQDNTTIVVVRVLEGLAPTKIAAIQPPMAGLLGEIRQAPRTLLAGIIVGIVAATLVFGSWAAGWTPLGRPKAPPIAAPPAPTQISPAVPAPPSSPRTPIQREQSPPPQPPSGGQTGPTPGGQPTPGPGGQTAKPPSPEGGPAAPTPTPGEAPASQPVPTDEKIPQVVPPLNPPPKGRSENRPNRQNYREGYSDCAGNICVECDFPQGVCHECETESGNCAQRCYPARRDVNTRVRYECEPCVQRYSIGVGRNICSQILRRSSNSRDDPKFSH